MLSAKEVADEHMDAFQDWWSDHQPNLEELVRLIDIKRLCELAFQEGIFMVLGDEDRE